MLIIDGSRGEGGGQVLRTCLSLSALTGVPFQINKIRANRSRPGLRPQHLTAVKALSAICDAEVDGAELDSTVLNFHPRRQPQGGEYVFDVKDASSSGKSAGAVTLIGQTLMWPLTFAADRSSVILRGGTFVPFSPAYHYHAQVALPAFSRLGVKSVVSQHKWGWMADGGGEILLAVEPAGTLKGMRFQTERSKRVQGIAAVTNLPSHIPHRMARRAHNLLEDAGLQPSIEPVRARGLGPGAGIVLWITQAGFSSLGRKGLPAEKVAETAVAELLDFMENGAAVDHHLADQLLLPMALAAGYSSFTVDLLTRHTLTNIELLRYWLEVTIEIVGKVNESGEITVQGIGFDLS